jgi:hypothetical protein
LLLLHGGSSNHQQQPDHRCTAEQTLIPAGSHHSTPLWAHSTTGQLQYLYAAVQAASSNPVTATKSPGPMCSAGGLPLRVTKSVGPLLLMSGASCGKKV